MNQSIVPPPYKRFGRSFFLALCLLQSANYACASQDLTEVRRMAEQGDAKAQSSLGIIYDDGEGVPQNFKQAFGWYLKAAEQGDAKGQFSVGSCYADGKGVAKDIKQGEAWYRKAAEQGEPLAQAALGMMYIDGKAVKQDLTQAYAWLAVSIPNGYPAAKGLRNTVANKLTSAQLEAAQELAAKYFEQYQPKK